MRVIRSRRIINRIKSLRLKGFGCRLIGRRLGVSQSFVYNVLRGLGMGEVQVRRCPFCGKRLVGDKVGRIGGHIGQHIRGKKWSDRDWQRAIRLWRKGLSIFDISKVTSISESWLRVKLKDLLGKEYLKERFKRRKGIVKKG
jgi:transposase-like protein